MKLIILVLFAMMAGIFYYMIAVAMTVYDGMGSLIFQPIIGAFFSGFAVLICLAIGSPIRVSSQLNRFWKKHWWISVAIGAVGFFLMMLSTMPGYQVEVYDSFLEENVLPSSPVLAVGGWFLTIFSILHFFPPTKLEFVRAE